MNSQNNSTGPATGNAGGGHEASGKHQGLHQPDNDQHVDDALDNANLEERGAGMEDHLRNKRGKGVRGEYDDSIDSDTADPDPAEDSMKSSEDAPTQRSAR